MGKINDFEREGALGKERQKERYHQLFFRFLIWVFGVPISTFAFFDVFSFLDRVGPGWVGLGRIRGGGNQQNHEKREGNSGNASQKENTRKTNNHPQLLLFFLCLSSFTHTLKT